LLLLLAVLCVHWKTVEYHARLRAAAEVERKATDDACSAARYDTNSQPCPIYPSHTAQAGSA
jgi:hypothetical protein